MRRGREEENAVEIPWGMVRIAVRMWSPIWRKRQQKKNNYYKNNNAGFPTTKNGCYISIFKQDTSQILTKSKIPLLVSRVTKYSTVNERTKLILKKGSEVQHSVASRGLGWVRRKFFNVRQMELVPSTWEIVAKKSSTTGKDLPGGSSLAEEREGGVLP